MRTTGLAIVLAAAWRTAFAQDDDLQRGEAGRLALGQCYSQCLARAHDSALAVSERLDRLVDLLISDEFFALTEASQDEVVAVEEQSICEQWMTHVRGLEGCAAGCSDIEVVYDVRSGAARSRFHHVLNRDRARLTASGLWTNFRDSPQAPDSQAFRAACDAFWDESAQATGFGGALRAVQELTRQRTARRSQAVDD